MKDTLSGYNNVSWTTTGMIILAIGWLLTSTKARAFIKSNKNVRNMALLSIVIIAILHVGLLITYCIKSYQIMDLLSKTKYVELSKIAEYYKPYKVHFLYVVGSATVNRILFILLFIMVNSSKKWVESDK